MISEPCSCCHATGRVEALETSFSKIEQEICRQLVSVLTTQSQILFALILLNLAYVIPLLDDVLFHVMTS